MRSTCVKRVAPNMGIYTMGPPEGLVRLLRNAYALSEFIETGTYHGATSAWAADLFERVVSIELAPALHQGASMRLAHKTNIDFRLGDTETVLAEIVPGLAKPALFWLNAHWSGGETAGETHECPLLGEIAAIERSPIEHFLLIDDARFFMSPPPPPHRAEEWPDLAAITSALSGKPRHITVFRDVIVVVPPSARGVVVNYCRNTRV